MDALEEMRKERAALWALQRKETDVIMLDDSPRNARSRSPRKREELSSESTAFKVLTWNIDGLDNDSDEEDMLGRTLWVVKQIRHLNPDVVFLQELVDFNFQIISQFLCKGFHIHVQEDAKHPYFVAVLVNKLTVEVIGKPIPIEFPNSKMGRAALFVSIRRKGSTAQYGCITTHLESLRESSHERMSQISIIDAFAKTRMEDTCIFGGDLNIRENEVPETWKDKDSWIIAGKDGREEFTWDLSMNSNARMPNGSKPRCRFDRIYLLKNESNKKVKTFKLVGKSPVEGLEGRRFASDHFGVFVSLGID